MKNKFLFIFTFAVANFYTTAQAQDPGIVLEPYPTIQPITLEPTVPIQPITLEPTAPIQTITLQPDTSAPIWDPAETYPAGSTVSYGTSSYTSLVAVPMGFSPLDDITNVYWQELGGTLGSPPAQGNDPNGPIVSNVITSINGDAVYVTYNLSDNFAPPGSMVYVEAFFSINGGQHWEKCTSLSGPDHGPNIIPGMQKSFTWFTDNGQVPAGSFPDTRIRVVATAGNVPGGFHGPGHLMPPTGGGLPQEWNPTTNYMPGDLVIYTLETFVANNMNMGLVPPLHPAEWTSLEQMPVWDAATPYNPGDIVAATAGATTYTALTFNMNMFPPTNPADWSSDSNPPPTDPPGSQSPSYNVYQIDHPNYLALAGTSTGRSPTDFPAYVYVLESGPQWQIRALMRGPGPDAITGNADDDYYSGPPNQSWTDPADPAVTAGFTSPSSVDSWFASRPTAIPPVGTHTP